MGFMGFAVWFGGGLIMITGVQIMIGNAFITGFFAALIMGFLGAKE